MIDAIGISDSKMILTLLIKEFAFNVRFIITKFRESSL